MFSRNIALAAMLVLACAPAHAQVRSSANYAITVDQVNSGGGPAASANYLLRGTIGQPAASVPMSSANYANNGGFQGSVPSPFLSVSPASLAFGSQAVGSSSASQGVTLTNTGNVLLSLASIGLTGTHAGDFGQSNACGPSLAVTANCVVSVLFAPTAIGARAASLQLASSATASPQLVGLTGTGTLATTTLGLVSSVNPSRYLQSVTFTATISGGASPSGTVQFKNGVADLGSPVAVAGGQAQFTTSALGIGTHSIGAQYSGDANHGGSSATAVNQVVRATARNDFDGDGRSDLLWMYASSGTTYVWKMNGTAIAGTGSPATVGGPGAGWSVQGIGDFNGDGRADVLWRNSLSGAVVVWLMAANGTSIQGTGSPATVSDPNWVVQGVGDFNGDGRADVLWRNTANGTVLVWLMAANGTSLQGTGSPATVNDANWTVQGIGDFNGDGRADILWRNAASGTVLAWLMAANGTSIQGTGSPATVSDANWVVQGIGDFNGDGRADVLWKYATNGNTLVWLMAANGTSIQGTGSPATVGPAAGGWEVKGVGDYNGDGRADIFWKHATNGATLVWLMNAAGTGIQSSGSPATIGTDPNWQVQNPK